MSTRGVELRNRKRPEEQNVPVSKKDGSLVRGGRPPADATYEHLDPAGLEGVAPSQPGKISTPTAQRERKMVRWISID